MNDMKPILFNVEKQSVNEHLEVILKRLDEVGSRPWDEKRTTQNTNNKIEYHRLKMLFLEECLKAFRAGKRFSE